MIDAKVKSGQHQVAIGEIGIGLADFAHLHVGGWQIVVEQPLVLTLDHGFSPKPSGVTSRVVIITWACTLRRSLLARGT